MRILYVTTISLTINTFFKPHIDMLVKEGNEVDIACNYSGLAIDDFYINLGCKLHQIDFSRSPFSNDNVKAYGQLKHLVKNGNYDIVHCHTPNASVITRLVCRKFRKKNGLKVFYTAHGFHFHQGAPRRNWMFFYPIERFCSRFTDKLITINREDYELAKKKFKAKDVHYVPGVGIDLSRFEGIGVDRAAKRREIGVPEDAFFILSVGELNENKNHGVVIRALAELRDHRLHYGIAGIGDKKEALLKLAADLGIPDQLHLLGYRRDIPELNYAADIFCFPSFREGLAKSVMEAMACGLPVVCSKIRGNIDLIDEYGGSMFDPASPRECRAALERVLTSDPTAMALHNQEKVKLFSQENVLESMRLLYDLQS